MGDFPVPELPIPIPDTVMQPDAGAMPPADMAAMVPPPDMPVVGPPLDTSVTIPEVSIVGDPGALGPPLDMGAIVPPPDMPVVGPPLDTSVTIPEVVIVGDLDAMGPPPDVSMMGPPLDMSVTIPEVVIVGDLDAMGPPPDVNGPDVSVTGPPLDMSATIPEATTAGDLSALAPPPDGNLTIAQMAGVVGDFTTAARDALPRDLTDLAPGVADFGRLPGETPFNASFGTGVGEKIGIGPDVAETTIGAAEDVGLLDLAATAAGATALGAGFAVGAVGPVLVGTAIEHADEVAQRADPDEASPPGGVPLQASPNGDAGAADPLQFPADQTSVPATDPITSPPVSAPSDQMSTPARDPSTVDEAKLPGQTSAGPLYAGDYDESPREQHVLPQELFDASDTSSPYSQRKAGGLEWTEPQTLAEQTALQDAKAGGGVLEMEHGRINDPMYADPGWVKNRVEIKATADGNPIDLHYMYNVRTHQIDQVKFIQQGEFKPPNKT